MKTVVVNDKMQKNYTYQLTAPMGEDFAPEFKPEVTPKEMLALGVFGGVYMRDCRDEFPADWFTDAKFAVDGRDAMLNFLKSTPVNHWPNGDARAGFMKKTHAAGFSGIAATTWGDVFLKKIFAK